VVYFWSSLHGIALCCVYVVLEKHMVLTDTDALITFAGCIMK